MARKRLFEIADLEKIDFNLEKRGILHFYHNQYDYDVAVRVNDLLNKSGLERYAVSNQEIKNIEPTLTEDYFGGFYCPDDATGDIHKYTIGLAEVCRKKGVKFLFGTEVIGVQHYVKGIDVIYHQSTENMHDEYHNEKISADAILVCGGVGSYQLAEMLGDRVNIYPVKGYSITVNLKDENSIQNAPWVSLLDESAKIVTSRLGKDRFRVAGTAEFNGYNLDIRADRIQPLIDWTNRHFDVCTESVVPWAGLRPMMPNMLPIVRQGNNQRVFYNTGHGHLGWTLSAITAAMISQEISSKFPV